MKTNVFNYKGHGPLGPGGYRCSCCCPAPGKRKVFVKQHKRAMYAILDKLEEDNGPT